jgi:sensor c-di-GMP phosphodiesterase-like protein
VGAVNKTAATVLTLAAAFIAIAAPVSVALYEARRTGLADETARTLAYARDAMHRTDVTAEQITHGIDEIIKARHGSDPCTEDNLAPMRDVDVKSSYIQAIGYVSGDRLVCSSLGAAGQGYPLGPVDAVTGGGARIRTHVHFPFAEGAAFLVVERDSYAAIIHKDLPIDVTTTEEDVALATFLSANKEILASRGSINPAWLRDVRPGSEATFIDGGFLVAVVHSSESRFTAAVAALPIAYLNRRERNLGWVLLPIGGIAGVGLALAVLHLARLQLALPTVLKAALRRHEFSLVYQPIVELQTGRWVGVEALIRWRRPSGEMIRPDLFIPAAEDSGLIDQITERVIALVARDAGDLLRRFPELLISINLSPADLHNRQTVARLQRLAGDVGAGTGNLIVEVTERGLLGPEETQVAVRDLRASGIRVAIDDFGIGFSSLSYLERFELDFLKIDKSFVEALGTDAPTSPVALHIIEIGKALHLHLIAEGVETEAQARFLRDHGVRYAQGWLYSKALSLTELVGHLSRQTAAQRV